MNADVLNYIAITLLFYFSIYISLAQLTCFGQCGISGIAIKTIIIAQLVKISVMVVLSCFQTLQYFYSLSIILISILLLSASAMGAYYQWPNKKKLEYYGEISIYYINEFKKFIQSSSVYTRYLVFLLFIFLFLFISLNLIRGAVFNDTTYDVDVYGIPKIALYYQNNSIFNTSGSSDLRIDAYERNGELNFLHGLLITRNPKFLGIVSNEIWISIFVGIYALSRVVGAFRFDALLIGTFLSTAPIIYGMSAVTKGDSYVVAFFLYGVYYLIQLIKGGNPQFGMFFFFVSLALACGTKMTSAYGVLALIFILICYKKYWNFPKWSELTLIVLSCAVASSKALQNLFLYGDPFKRSDWEKQISGFSWNNFVSGIQNTLEWIFPTGTHFSISGYLNDMEKTMGLTFYVLVLGLFFLFYHIFARRHNTLHTISETLRGIECKIIFLVLLAAVFLFSMIPTEHPGFKGNWGRYLMPYAITIATLSCVMVFRFCRPLRSQFILSMCISIAILYNVIQASRPSAIITAHGRIEAIKHIFLFNNNSSKPTFSLIEARLHSFFEKLAMHVKNVNIIQINTNIPIAAAFGPMFQWNVSIFDTSATSDVKPDMYFFTTRKPDLIPDSFTTDATAYHVVWRTGNVVIVLRNDIAQRMGLLKS